MITSEKDQISLFYSYAHPDEKLRNKLNNHLSLLSKRGLIAQWYDRNISAGTVWVDQIDHHLNTAHIILLLISSDFLASDYCYSLEMARALERYEAGEARVIPILLRPVDWKHAPFAQLQVLPQNAVPVTSWKNQDLAFQDIAIQLRKVVEELRELQMNLPLYQGEPAMSSTPQVSQESSANKQIDVAAGLLQAVDEFRHCLKRVNELKNVHDKLDEIELNLAILPVSIQLFTQDQSEFDMRNFKFIEMLWQNVVLKIEDLVYFASKKMEVLEDERFSFDSGVIRGAPWVKEPFVLQQFLETAISDQDVDDVQKLSRELLTKCRAHLHRIDKRLLEAVEQLDCSSDLLIRYRT